MSGYYMYILIFFASILSIATIAQDEFESLEFIYVDNSQIDSDDGLSYEMISQISDLVNSRINDPDTKVAVFASDLLNPQYSENSQGTKRILNDLRGRSTRYLFNSFKEKSFIRDNLLETEFKVKNGINFHFFVSDYFCKDILPSEDVSIGNLMLVNTLPKEIIDLLSVKEDKCQVTVYFPNKTGTVSKEDLINVLEYNTDPRFTSRFKTTVKDF